jgi:GNAT superfamily N-acetyltransferase
VTRLPRVISAATPDDAAGAAELANHVYPDQLITTAGLRHQLTSQPPEARRATWKAETDGVVVGWASAQLEVWASAPGHALSSVMVHPEWRGRGVGAALWERAALHLQTIGGTHVVVQSSADDASRRFCETRGFTLSSTSEMLALDPSVLSSPPPAPAGVELRPCSAYHDDLDTLYRVDYSSSQDEPGDYDFSGLTFEQWRTMSVGHPDFDWELSLGALVDGSLAGVSLFCADRARGRAMNVGTGVLREHRNRGLATLMKRHGLARAAQAGITRVITQNDDTNAPMLAINRRLGYEPFATRHGWTLDR